jgi:head-to-tail connecting protein
VKTRARELLETGDKLFSKRFPLLTLWQTFAENFDPMHADFTRVRWISEEFASYLMTGRPVMAHRELTNALSSILRPRGVQWFECITGNEQVDNDRDSKMWLEAAGKTMRGIMNDRRSQFGRATKEADGFYTLTGQAILEPRLNADRNGLLLRSWHPRDCVWTENAELSIDGFHRKWKLQARQMVDLAKRAGWELDPKVKERAGKDPLSEINNRVIVVSAEEYDSFGKDEEGYANKRDRRFPFVCIEVDEDNQKILKETPQHTLGYNIPRWVTLGGFSQYAYSPSAVVALPDGRMLQQMTLMLLEMGSKVVDPPMAAVGDVIQGGVNLYAGAVNWIDPDYDERTGAALRQAVELHPEGLNWGDEREDRIERVINEAFYLNVLNLPQYDQKAMTAEEWRGRMQEYVRRATPLFEPMDVEYNGLVCESIFDITLRNGGFGSPLDMPQPLRQHFLGGQPIAFKFQNPLVAAEAEQKTNSFVKLSQLLGAAMQIEPTTRADVDMDAAFRDAVPGTGSPASWLLPKDKADQLKAQMAQEQQAAAAAAKLSAGAQVGSQVGQAAKNVGDAAQSMRAAGML